MLKQNLPGQGLIAGTFTGALVFRSGTISVSIPVSVVVGADVFRQVNPISFVKPLAGVDPLSQTLTVASTGVDFTFTYAAASATGGNWLTVANVSFNDCGLCSTPQTLRVNANPSPALAAGTYTGQVVLTARDGSQSITVPITLTIANPSTAFFDNLPGQMSFSFVTSGANPPSQSIQIRNGGTGTLSWTLDTKTADGGAWLSPSLSTGNAPSTITVSLLKQNLPGQGLVAGTFVGELILLSSGSSVTIPVSVIVRTDAFEQVNALNYTMPFSGANPLPQTITIASTGANFTFTVGAQSSNGGNWLSVDNVSFNDCGLCSTPQTLRVSAHPSPGLAAGTYTGQIILTARDSSEAMTVPVSLTIASSGAFFDNLPGQMSFFMTAGGSNPASHTIGIRNGGSGSLNWTSTTTTSDGGSWLSVAPGLGGATTATVAINSSALPGGGLVAGNFTGEIVLDSGGSSASIPVAVYVGPNVFVQLNTLVFARPVAAANPPPQVLNIASTGTAIQFTVNAYTGKGSPWLTVSTPLSCGLCITPAAISANIVASPSLAAGTYTGEIVITARDSSEAMTIPVLLVIGSPTPAITSVAPNTTQVGGTQPNVAITGQDTHFVQGTTVANFGAGVTVNSLTINSGTSATANVTVQSNAAPGARNVTLTTGTEVATLLNGFTVSGTPAIQSVTPNTGQTGQTLASVAIVGLNTNFLQGTTVASFGAGVTINSLTVNSSTSATANITVQANAAAGARDVTLTTGSEVATLTNGFTVTGAATLQSIAVTPANPSIAKGQTQQFAATGTFSDNSTQNLTSQVTWASATTSVATITSGGLATGVATGTSTISAKLGSVTGSTVLTVTAATLQSIAVTPANPSIAKGQTQQFTATGTFSDNSTQNLTAQVTWASATTSVATITSGGLATGVATGTSTISAKLGSVTGSTVLTVTAETLQSIAVTPANPSIAKGLTLQFTATGTFSDNSTQNLTAQVTWASATTSVATITSGGLATGVATGTSTISAKLGSVTGSTVLTVTAAVLQLIAVTPANPTISKGQTQQFTATGTFSDNSTQNLTAQVTWASATTSVATITSGGLATGVATGTSTISAKLGSITGSTVLTVTAAVLQSIAVTPANPTISKGQTQQFAATGTFSDNSTQNLTSQVTWASATTSVATITSGGLATAVATGTSTISAKLGSITGSTVLTVTAATLQSIAVTPANPTISKGQTQQFTATGTFSDNSTQNLTSQVTWASATTSVATITSGGLATGVAAGTSTISAKLNNITGSTVLTVTAAVLQSIAVTPANPSITKGLTQQFTATGTFSDNSTQNLTSQVTWASATTSVATIASGGLATGVATGTSTISAKLGGVTGSTVLTVTAAVLQSIAVTPANPMISKGQTQQFTATGTFSDNSTQNLTGQVTWASATTSVATITSGGLAIGVAAGTSTISAKLNNITGSTVLTVTAAVLQSIALTPANPSITKGLTQQFTATGTFSDNSTQNLTGQVTWASATTSVATITSGGLATGVATGTSTVSATLGGITGSTVLTVTPQDVLSFNVLFGTESYNVVGTTRNRLPWQIIGIQVVFARPIVAGNINSLGGVTTTGFTGLGTNTLTWTISPLSLGNLPAILSGTGPNALKDANGAPIDNGAGFSQNLKILMGDFNDDGVVSSADLVGINDSTTAPYNLFADINGDGAVDVSDVALARTRIGTSLP